MPRQNLGEEIEGRVVSGEIVADKTQPLAVDVLDRWAAVFRFSVSPDGEFHTETEVAQRMPDGRWEFIVGGGMSGTGWALPWTPPSDGWNNRHLRGLGYCGMDVELDDGTERELIATCGFASAKVEEIRVRFDSGERTITPGPTGAFVAVALGNGFGFVELTPIARGSSLSAALTFPNP